MKPILTMDFETDPFLHGRVVKPFAVGLYDGQNFDSFWGSNCASKIVEHLKRLPESIIYMHNGGRFDLYFLFDYLEREMLIINGRIVQCKIGKHEIRDSYSIFPMQLAKYKKDDIDITHLESHCRESYKDEILSYLRGDCVYLHEIVTGFLAEFGDHLTIGSAAMHQLEAFHPFHHGGSGLDDQFRKRFFFGGRVQCFKSGIIDAPFKIYDVNSMYPHVMESFVHPCATAFEVGTTVTKDTQFIVAQGKQLGPYGAFPSRDKKGSIDFTVEHGEFACTIHEWKAALDCGYFKPTRILRAYNCKEVMCFREFVEHFFNKKLNAKLIGDLLRVLFYKLILNSAYGKFAQNAAKFRDWCITHGERLPAPWSEHFIHQNGSHIVWEKPCSRKSYYNVCIAASITGAARSVLMRAIRKATDPIYCDTDSITCKALPGVEIDDSKLGAWALETEGTRLAIAGKKIYACFDANGKCVKKATKGAKLTPEEIVKVAGG